MAEAYQALRVERAEGVLTLTLDRPDVLNSFDALLKRELLAALTGAGRERDVRALVITGAGRAFSAGQDLRERDETGGAVDLAKTLRRDYNPIILALRRLEKPVVAAVNGVAAGAGFSLALACDIRLAAEGASFIAAFGRVGLVPDSGMSWFLPRLVGPGRAAEIVFTAEPVDAATAERIGLVNRVLPAEQLLPEAQALAGRLAAGAPLALALAKRGLDRAQRSDLTAALEYEAQLQGIAGRSKDHAEGTAAFREKRPPRFSGE
ncbi:MAG TPA: enoyl-CoA hydratase-related protein [Candidatus Limnocylindrales bacterium]|nr:enoyl-CoA hydratase-related protein [Candidatus Limnocylindrales bacterium]